ncbi:MAG: quinone-dependent dihydroorotate dehydrogenase [Flavobacteriales bacterium]
MYRLLIKPLFFLFKPERAHYLAMDLLQFTCALPGGKPFMRALFSYHHPSLEKEVCGIRFKNPVGLAAGFDKNAKWVDALECLGFGFVEIGTVTPLAQPGNDQPRLFRLPKDFALINRMGFNNEGAKAAKERLKKRKSSIVIGGNIGKNKITPNEEATSDYVKCFDELFDVVDYFVVNVSSPNTPGLRELQDKEPLTKLLVTLQTNNSSRPLSKPIFLKIAPDLTDAQLDDIVNIVKDSRIAGVIATNTTIDRSSLQTTKDELDSMGNGGLSGLPLTKRATDVVQYLAEKSQGQFPIIGVGGIHTGAQAKEKMNAGAALVQVYTGFIYEGPSLAKRICQSLVR